MAKKVAPDDLRPAAEVATFKFKKPVPTKPEPMDAFAPQFLTRLAEIEEKTHMVTVSSGRSMGYFDESGPAVGAAGAWAEPAGEQGRLPVVLCIHGLGQGKELWIMQEPVPGVRLIAVDRFGYGNSSVQPAPYGFGAGVAELAEALDKIGVEKFFVVGHSAGGNFTLQVAAGLGDRVLGVATIAAQCDMYHETAPKLGSKEFQSFLAPPLGSTIAKACGPQPGCCSRLVRYVVLKRMFGSMMYEQHKDRDCGFYELYTENARKGDGGCERTWEAMDKDPFFVSTNLYATLNGCNDKSTPLGDVWRNFNKWDHDCSKFKGHCVVYSGDLDLMSLPPMAEQTHRAIPQSELVMMPGHGHTTIMLEAPTIIQALIAGKTAKQVF